MSRIQVIHTDTRTVQSRAILEERGGNVLLLLRSLLLLLLFLLLSLSCPRSHLSRLGTTESQTQQHLLLILLCLLLLLDLSLLLHKVNGQLLLAPPTSLDFWGASLVIGSWAR